MKRRLIYKWSIFTFIIIVGSMISASISRAAVNQENTETNKVEIDNTVSIAETGQYKDMDVSFLKTFDYGSSEETTLVFDTVEELQQSTLKTGIFIKTLGYYVKGDGGAACYLISAKKETGGIALANGLYANIRPDSYSDAEGTRWMIASVKQFGAKGDGTQEDQDAINHAIKRVGELVDDEELTKNLYDRGLVYLPEGEYKCGNQLRLGYSNMNIVGEGDKSVIFTDNDYRDTEGYSEFFFECWGTNNSYLGDFRIEAREVDLYHYMRQLVILYCDTVYVYQVDLIVPQSAYNSYYFEDKQYSNLCCYTGNKNITIDGCTMEQLSGTYRGANLGILDIWSAGEENITVMNCELYGNARDEQVGFFSKNDENASVKHVNFINNTMHSVQLKYTDIVGTRTMCFSIAYADSKNVEDIRVAGNHFICEADSKFMTVGTVKNLVIEDNIIEIIASNGVFGSVFDISNSYKDPDQMTVRNNEFYITGKTSADGKQNVLDGEMNATNNRILYDCNIAFNLIGTGTGLAQNNEIVGLGYAGRVMSGVYHCKNNRFELYGGYGHMMYYEKADAKNEVFITDNLIYSYRRYIGERKNHTNGFWQAMGRISGATVKAYHFNNNKYYAPNVKYTGTENGVTEYNRVWYINNEGCCSVSTIEFKNNVLQGTKSYVSYGDMSNVTIVDTGNKTLPYTVDEQEEICSRIDMTKDGKVVREITVTEDSVKLDEVLYTATSKDADGKVLEEKELTGKEVRWYTSVEGIATVDSGGFVTRKMYGDVKVYAVPLDGSKVYGVCLIHFAKKQAEAIEMAKETVTLQPGLKYYAEYTVLPEGTAQDLIWESSDETIATVDHNGMVTGVKKGTATITAKTTDGSGVESRFRVRVDGVTVKKITLDNSYLYFKEGEIGTSRQIKVTAYTPENATNIGIKKWESSNTEVATVDQKGNVKAVASGKATIYAYSMDMECYGKCSIYVQLPKVENLAAKATDEKITLTWNKQEKADGYYVYQWNTATSQWDVLNNGNYVKENYYHYTEVKKNTNYKFSVRAYMANWQNGTRIVHESDNQVVTVKTLDYIPVTSVNCNTKLMSIPKGGKKTWVFGYSPVTANYKNLQISYNIENLKIAKLAQKETADAAKKTENVTIEALDYGVTYLTCSSNDEYGASVKVPVGVITPVKVSGGDDMTVTATADKAMITFTGLENETELVAQGAMTGYMIRRTQSIEFSNVGYIPASGQGVYQFEDTTVASGKGYSYSVTPCLKNGEDYFVGYDNGRHDVTIPMETMAESVSSTKDLWTVTCGSEKIISAKIIPENATETTLQWVSENEDVVTVAEKKVTQPEAGMDYATVEGKQIGTAKVLAKTKDGSKLETSMVVVVVPAKVENLQSATTASTVGLLWDAEQQVSGYHVYRKDVSSNAWQLIGNVCDNTFTDSNVTESNMYTYKVVAYYTYGGTDYEGQSSDTVTVITPVVLPSTNPKEDADTEVSGGIEDTSGAIVVCGYTGAYDGKTHASVEISGIRNGDRVTYSLDSKTWTYYIPQITNVSDSKVIYICITRDGKNYYYSVVSKISALDLKDTDIRLGANTAEWNGKQQKPALVLGDSNITPQDYTVSYLGNCKDVGSHYVVVDGKGNYTGSVLLEYEINLIKGHTYTVGNYRYKLTASNKATVVGVTTKKLKKIAVADTVKMGGKTVKVTAVAEGAFRKCTLATTATIGKNVTTIGDNAFSGDKKLKKITFKGNAVKKIGKNAWKNISRKNVFYVPKKSWKKYNSLIKAKKTNWKATMKIKKK